MFDRMGSVQGVQGVVRPPIVEECSAEDSGVGIACLKVQPQGKYLLVLLASGSVRFWNTETKVRPFCLLSLHIHR